jgi:hypothetical protein
LLDEVKVHVLRNESMYKLVKAAFFTWTHSHPVFKMWQRSHTGSKNICGTRQNEQEGIAATNTGF